MVPFAGYFLLGFAMGKLSVMTCHHDFVKSWEMISEGTLLLGVC